MTQVPATTTQAFTTSWQDLMEYFFEFLSSLAI